MVTNNPEDKDENLEEEQFEPKKLTYEDLVQIEPEREVNIDKVSSIKTIDEEESESPMQSDFKVGMNRLFPKFPNKRIDDLLRSAMVSRIFPDNYLDKLFLGSAYIMEETMLDEDYDPLGIIFSMQDGLSIAYNGMSRPEILEGIGAEREATMEELSKSLGM